MAHMPAEQCESRPSAAFRTRFRYWMELVVAGRLRQRLSSRALAAKAGMSVTSLHNLEQGHPHANPPLAQWRALLQAAGVPLDLAGFDLAALPQASELYTLVVLLQSQPAETTTHVLAIVRYMAQQREAVPPRRSRGSS